MKTRLSLLIAALVALSAPLKANPEPLIEATFKLFNKSSTATCFVLHEPDAPESPFIISAAHVFEKMQGETALLVLRTPREDGGHRRRDYKISIREGDKPLWVRHPEHDIAVLPIEKPADLSLPSLPTSVLLPEADFTSVGLAVCDRIFVLTYPERFEANTAGFPVARGATIASYPIGPIKYHPSFLADFTAFGGDSGGPAFVPRAAEELPLIVGIVVAQFRHDEKLKSLNEERILHHPLGLGKVLHAELIRATIKLALEKR